MKLHIANICGSDETAKSFDSGNARRQIPKQYLIHDVWYTRCRKVDVTISPMRLATQKNTAIAVGILRLLQSTGFGNFRCDSRHVHFRGQPMSQHPQLLLTLTGRSCVQTSAEFDSIFGAVNIYTVFVLQYYRRLSTA